jgi:hypothetical protein
VGHAEFSSDTLRHACWKWEQQRWPGHLCAAHRMSRKLIIHVPDGLIISKPQPTTHPPGWSLDITAKLSEARSPAECTALVLLSPLHPWTLETLQHAATAHNRIRSSLLHIISNGHGMYQHVYVQCATCRSSRRARFNRAAPCMSCAVVLWQVGWKWAQPAVVLRRATVLVRLNHSCATRVHTPRAQIPTTLMCGAGPPTVQPSSTAKLNVQQMHHDIKISLAVLQSPTSPPAASGCKTTAHTTHSTPCTDRRLHLSLGVGANLATVGCASAVCTASSLHDFMRLVHAHSN